MYNLYDTNKFMAKNVNFYNKRKTSPTARTAICIISKVNEEKLTVDVIIPSTSSQITNVTIATNLISQSGTGITMLPTEGQKGVLLTSSQHSAILIATLPNPAPDNRNSALLSGEFKLGSNDSFIKLAKNKSLSMKTLSSSSILNNDNESVTVARKYFKGYGVETESSFNEDASMGYSKEVFFNTSKTNYFKSKDVILNGNGIDSDVKNDILNSNMMLLDKFNSLIYRVDELNSELELGSLDSIDKLDKLKEDIISRYTFSDYSNKLVIEKGATEDNIGNNSLFTATLCKDGEENSSVSLHEDGTIKITCKDFLIERKE